MRTVMPVEIIKVAFKPVNFFEKNPALDVPPSTQEFNRSTLVSEQHQQGTQEMSVGECCADSKTSSKL